MRENPGSLQGKWQVELRLVARDRLYRSAHRILTAKIAGAHAQQSNAPKHRLLSQALSGALPYGFCVLGRLGKTQFAGAYAEIVKADFHAYGPCCITLAP